MSAVKTIKWTGSKSFVGGAYVGKWVLANLPQPASHRYMELFGGSAAVLVNKPKVKIETYNDINNRLYRFWGTLQRRGDELAAMVDSTLAAEASYYEAVPLLDDADDLTAAWAFFITTTLRFPSPSGQADISEGSPYTQCLYPNPLRRTDLLALRDRITDVMICNRPAEFFLKQKMIRQQANMDIYLDPPYHSLAKENVDYGHDYDPAALADLLDGNQMPRSNLRHRQRMGLLRLAENQHESAIRHRHLQRHSRQRRTPMVQLPARRDDTNLVLCLILSPPRCLSVR